MQAIGRRGYAGNKRAILSLHGAAAYTRNGFLLFVYPNLAGDSRVNCVLHGYAQAMGVSSRQGNDAVAALKPTNAWQV